MPVLLLAPWFGVIFDRDEGAYATIAMGMSDGLVPYRDLFDHKPPGIYVVYWTSFLFGTGVWQPRIAAAIFIAATALLIVRTTREMGASTPVSYAAGLLFGLSVSNLGLRMNANTEAFTLLPMVGALFATWKSGARWAALAGALSAAAVLLKTSSAFPALGLLVFMLAYGSERPQRALAFVAGGAATGLLAAAPFVASGAFGDLWYANVTYNQIYTSEVPWGDRAGWFADMNRQVLVGGFVFWMLGAAGFVVESARRTSRSWLLGLWAIAGWIGLKFTGRELAHYYVQLLPVAAIYGAFALGALATRLRTRGRRIAVYVVALPLVVWQGGLYVSYAFDAQARAEIHSESLYECDAAAPAIGAWVTANTAPGERVYNLGRDTGIYFYAGRTPAHQMMYDRAFHLDPPTERSTVADLRRNPPRLIIDSRACIAELPALPEMERLLADDYEYVATVEHATMYELAR